MKLRTTPGMYRDAADRMNSGRGKTVTIPRPLFSALVIDHSRLVAFAEKWQERIISEGGDDEILQD